MRVAIVEDELNAMNHLKKQLGKYMEYDELFAFTDPLEGLSFLLREKVDVLFLDIDMPKINGIYIAEQVSHIHTDTKICFVTAHNGFAIKAFELNAIDYILKPYSDARVQESIKKTMSVKNSF